MCSRSDRPTDTQTRSSQSDAGAASVDGGLIPLGAKASVFDEGRWLQLDGWTDELLDGNRPNGKVGSGFTLLVT